MNYLLGLITLTIVSIFTFGSCKTVHLSPEEYAKSKVYFGNGGGFTGKLNEFCMLENGEVYVINPASREAVLRNNAAKSVTKSIFKTMGEMDMKKYPYDQPGNMYYWMKYESKTDSSYLIWGHSDMVVDEKVSHIYEELVALTKEK